VPSRAGGRAYSLYVRRPEEGISFVASLSLPLHKRLAPSLKLKKKKSLTKHQKNNLYKFSKDFRTGTNYAGDSRSADTSERQDLRVTDRLRLTGRYVTLGTAFFLSSTSVVPSSATLFFLLLFLCYFLKISPQGASVYRLCEQENFVCVYSQKVHEAPSGLWFDFNLRYKKKSYKDSF
jgi:hypothetical protein